MCVNDTPRRRQRIGTARPRLRYEMLLTVHSVPTMESSPVVDMM